MTTPPDETREAVSASDSREAVPVSACDELIPLGRSGRWVTISEAGIECCFWIDAEPDPVQSVIEATRSFYEVDALRLLSQLLGPAPRIVDVGANIGNHSVYFDRICGAQWVLPLEPNPEVLPELRANLAANRCSAADLTHLGVAAGAERGALGIRLDGSDRVIRNRGGARLVPDMTEDEPKVQVWPLDEIVGGGVDLLKIDVEGMAVAVLEGAKRLVTTYRPLIFVEVSVEEMPAVYDWARRADYELIAALADYAGLTNMVLRPATAAGAAQRVSAEDSEAKIARAMSQVAAEAARAKRADATAALAHSIASEAKARAEAAENEAREAALRAEAAENEVREAVLRAEAVEERAASVARDLTRRSAELARLRQIEASHMQSAQRAILRAVRADERAASIARDLTRQNAELARLRQIEASFTWRATLPIRRVLGLLPVHLRRGLRRVGHGLVLHLRRGMRAVETRRRRADRPESRAGPTPARTEPVAPPVSIDPHSTAGTPGLAAAPCRPRALVVDSRWPEPDRDSGSVDAINLVTALIRLGYETTFYAAVTASDDEYRRRLEQLGVTCLSITSSGSLQRLLETDGESLSLCVLSRVHAGGRFFEEVRRFAGDSRVVFNTVDLHFLREEREARLKGDRGGLILAAGTRERELHLVRQADATIVVSSEERRLLEAAVPGARVFELPLAREVRRPTTTFEARSGIGFIGGFTHPPNVDAVQFFLSEVWPLVLRDLPDCEFRIAGADLRSTVLRPLPDGVHYVGHVPDLSLWFDTLRLSVAPLRYGAGAKGKVASSLAHGVPCVATPVAVEGMRIPKGAGVLVEASAEGLARTIVDTYSDPRLWSDLSAAGLEYAEHQLSPENWRRRLEDLLIGLGMPPSTALHHAGSATHTAVQP